VWRKTAEEGGARPLVDVLSNPREDLLLQPHAHAPVASDVGRDCGAWVKRSTGHTHTHTPTENNTPDNDTHLGGGTPR